MDASAWLAGVGLGLALAAPVGPVNLLCVRRTLLDGWRAGLATGVGAAVADALLGALVLGSVSAASATLLAYAPALRSAGGALLVVCGILLGCAHGRALRAADPPAARRARALVAAFGASFVLTLSNPLPLLGLATALALGGGDASWAATSATASRIAGLACGSLAWWLGLTSAVACCRARFGDPGPDRLRTVNRAVGAALVAIGAFTLVRS